MNIKSLDHGIITMAPAACISILLVTAVIGPSVRAADSAADQLASLKKALGSAEEELNGSLASNGTETEKNAAFARYKGRITPLARRGLTLAEAHPNAPEALDALVLVCRLWADAERDAAYDLMARSYLDRDAILQLIRVAWREGINTEHSGMFLRAAADRSPNPKVRALAAFSLGQYYYELSLTVRSLRHPIRGKRMEKFLSQENLRRLFSLKPERLKIEAEKAYERVLRDFAGARPLGQDFPPLGVQAEAAIFRLRNLEVGCTAPDIEGVDVDGRPMKLSEFRGKVVVLSFWATWCAPCMALVPSEKALVERMKGRPFALVGVNGDEDRNKAKAVSEKHGINWRSFWEGGRLEGTPVRWGIDGWPTVYLIDAKGVIRDDALVGHELDQAVESLIAELEAKNKD